MSYMYHQSSPSFLGGMYPAQPAPPVARERAPSAPPAEYGPVGPPNSSNVGSRRGPAVAGGVGYSAASAFGSDGMGYNPINNPVNDDIRARGYQKVEPFVDPEPIVQALRQRSLNPEGIRRNAKTFRGTGNAPVAPQGKTNPSGANRSAQVTSQV